MKKINLVTILILITLKFIVAQSAKIEYISKLTPQYVDSIAVAPSDTAIFVKFNFAKSSILNPEILKNIEKKTVTNVTLVYSTYKESDDFNQYQLNYQRLVNLQKIAPSLFNVDYIKWSIVGEDYYDDLEKAQTLFCGFLIQLRKNITEENTEEEIKKLYQSIKGLPKSDITIKKGGIKKRSYTFNTKCYSLDQKKKGYIISIGQKEILEKQKIKRPKLKGGEHKLYNTISENINFTPVKKMRKHNSFIGIYSFQINQLGQIFNAKTKESNALPSLDSSVISAIYKMNNWSVGQLNNNILEFNFIVTFYKQSYRVPYSNKLFNVIASNLNLCQVIDTSKVEESLYTTEYSIQDSTIFKTFERNNKWKKSLVVADLTGSMSPYAAQLMIWLKLKYSLKNERIKQIAFFNDGDNMPDDKKIVGNVGGIYQCSASILDSVLNKAALTMRNGSGGDGPENNIEALLKSIEKCPDCDDVIMIADNYATPRDLELTENISKPIKLILCGTNGGINTKYLDFLKLNGGSLHLMEQDILNIVDLNEGQEIEIEGINYILKNRYFTRVY